MKSYKSPPYKRNQSVNRVNSKFYAAFKIEEELELEEEVWSKARRVTSPEIEEEMGSEEQEGSGWFETGEEVASYPKEIFIRKCIETLIDNIGEETFLNPIYKKRLFEIVPKISDNALLDPFSLIKDILYNVQISQIMSIRLLLYSQSSERNTEELNKFIEHYIITDAKRHEEKSSSVTTPFSDGFDGFDTRPSTLVNSYKPTTSTQKIKTMPAKQSARIKPLDFK